jgi:succinate dehydrogenase/fumarate reductase cytochrome b subunit
MLIKALSLLVPASLLLWYSLVLFKRRLSWSALQLVGAAALVITVLTHVCEGLALFPWMGWGAESSPGHYLDLSSAVLGLTLFPTGWLIRFVSRRM